MADKENDIAKDFFTQRSSSGIERSTSGIERMTSPLKDFKFKSSGFVKNEEYYLEKLRAQRQKIQLLIGEFSKLTDALDERDEQIDRLKESKEKYEELKGQWQLTQKAQTELKREQLQLKQENEQFRDQIRDLKADTEKQRLKGDIRCLQQRVNFFENRAQSLQRANTQLKEQKQLLSNRLQTQKEQSEVQIKSLKEKFNITVTQLQETAKINIQEMTLIREILAEKTMEALKLAEQVKQIHIASRTETLKHENEVRQTNQTLQLKEKQLEYQSEAFEQELKETNELLQRREQQLNKYKIEATEKKLELEKAESRLQEFEIKLKSVQCEIQQCRYEKQNNEEVKLLQGRVAQLEDKNREYQEYLYMMRNETLQEEKIRKEFQMKRNQQVDRIEKIFNRIRAKGIDLVMPE